MKIVSFTMVNNESEIIESFIRYNANFVDEMVIIDNCCTDSTIPIVRRLIGEGYAVTVYDESLEAYNQFRLDNKYLDRIIRERQPDLILPLDADEFLIADDGDPREALEKLPLDRIYYIHWQWYVMTREDDPEEPFIPKRLQYCLKTPAWNYADGTPVTKTILPAQYYRSMGLTLSMGHHTVFGNERVRIETLAHIRLAHYRAVSEQQLVYKTCCYSMRDIAAMENNAETAQRTNQMALIESGVDMWEAAESASYAGYPREIVHRPIDLSVCRRLPVVMRYSTLAKEKLALRVMATGREMAIRAYNAERAKKEKAFLKPIVLWLDGVRGEECLFPDPSNRLTVLTEMYNVRGLLTTTAEIRFLKANYRLIVTPDFVKFLLHRYVVIPDTVDFAETKERLTEQGVAPETILSLREYRQKLGPFGNLYCLLRFLPSMAGRVGQYIRRNGVRHTLCKLQQRLGK